MGPRRRTFSAGNNNGMGIDTGPIYRTLLREKTQQQKRRERDRIKPYNPTLPYTYHFFTATPPYRQPSVLDRLTLTGTSQIPSYRVPNEAFHTRSRIRNNNKRRQQQRLPVGVPQMMDTSEKNLFNQLGDGGGGGGGGGDGGGGGGDGGGDDDPPSSMYSGDGIPGPVPIPEWISATIPKRIISGLSEFMYFTVHQQVTLAIRALMAQHLDIESPINYQMDLLSPQMARDRYFNNPAHFIRVRPNNQPPVTYHNPIRRQPHKSPAEELLLKTVQMKRDIEREAHLRKGISQQAIKFNKTIVRREFFNPSNRGNNFKWQSQVTQITEKVPGPVDEITGRRRLMIKPGLIGFHLNHMAKIYQSCFPVLVKMQGVELEHKYVFDMVKKLNQMASLVNAVGKGRFSPTALAFCCLKRNPNLRTLNQLKYHLLVERRYGDLNLDNILEFDMVDVFGNTNNKTSLLHYLNPGSNAVNYTDPINALLIDDIAQDLLPIVQSEVILLTLLFLIGNMYPDYLQKDIDAAFAQAFEHADPTRDAMNNNGQRRGCFTVLQSFPGLFTLLCYWSRTFAHHSLSFVQTLSALLTGSKGMNRESYITHMKTVSKELTTIVLEIMDSIRQFELERVFGADQTAYSSANVPSRKTYAELFLGEYRDYLINTSYLTSNSFIVWTHNGWAASPSFFFHIHTLNTITTDGLMLLVFLLGTNDDLLVQGL